MLFHNVHQQDRGTARWAAKVGGIGCGLLGAGIGAILTFLIVVQPPAQGATGMGHLILPALLAVVLGLPIGAVIGGLFGAGAGILLVNRSRRRR